MPFPFKGEPLVGKSNYIEWKTKADLYLEINGYMPYIDGSKNKPDKSLYYKTTMRDNQKIILDEPYSPETAIKYYERLTEYEENQNKALGALKSILSIENIERFKTIDTAYSLYKSIKETFGETSFEQIGLYLDKINYTRYSDAKTMDSYTSTIQSSYYSLEQLGHNPSKANIAWQILKGLPSSYDAFISRKYAEISEIITKKGDIDLNKLIAELISEENRIQSFIKEEDKAYISKSQNKLNKGIKYCKHCHKTGHIEEKCWLKYPELKPKAKNAKKSEPNKAEKNRSSILIASNSNIEPNRGLYNFILDSGASEHWTPYREWLKDYIVDKKTIYLANNTEIEALGYGNIDILVYNQKTNNNIPITIEGVYYAPNISYNLLSLKRVLEKGWNITAQKDKIVINNDIITIWASWYNNLCQLRFKIPDKDKLYIANSYIARDRSPTLDLIHQRLAHIGQEYIKETIANTTGISLPMTTDYNTCEPCLKAKMHKTKGQNLISNASKPLELVHTDISGPYKLSLNRKRYYISFIDDYTKSIWIFAIAAKSEAIDALKELYNKLYTNLGYKIARIRSDNAGEYTGAKWTEFTKEKGIINEYTAPYSPEQNGVAERYNRTLASYTRAILHAKAIPYILWPYIFESVAYILNRTYNKAIKKTPYEALLGSRPDISNIRILGSIIYRRLPIKDSKLDQVSEKGILIGFKSINYQVYIPEKKAIRVVRDITILEDKEYSPKESNIDNLLELEDKEDISQEPTKEDLPKTSIEVSHVQDRPQQEELEESESVRSTPSIGSTIRVSVPGYSGIDDEEQELEETPAPPRRSERLRARHIQDTAQLASTAYISLQNSDIEDIDEFKEPRSYQEAMNSPEKDLWQKAMEKELQTLKDNDTWSLQDIPDNIRPITTKWVYKIKKNDDKSLTYKARLVARGFEQIYGLEYTEKFAAVIKQQAFKTVFAIATIKGHIIWKIDAKSAFTHGDLAETIYIYQPQGFIDPRYPNRALLLNKALYGLKQAANVWNTLLSKEIIRLGFIQLHSDTCIYYNKGRDTTIIVYVDDIAITGPDTEYICQIIAELKKRFTISDLGPIKSYLGIDISRTLDYKTTILSQKDYIIKILKKFKMDQSNPVSTPMEPGFVRKKYTGIASNSDIKWYQQAIGSLIYPAILTRWDIAVEVGILARYMSNPGPDHIKAVKRILRYLNGHLDHDITFIGNTDTSPYINGYVDSDYAGDKEEYKSTTGYIFFLANGPITYGSKIQPITAQSTTEAEYIAMSKAAKEATYIKALATELGFYNQNSIPLYCDNNGAIQLAKNPAFHERSKHIGIRYHFIRQKLADNTISIHYIPTKDQKADGLTKPLPTSKFKDFIKLIQS